jgi:F-type H+-transporting ATPase subunit b
VTNPFSLKSSLRSTRTIGIATPLAPTPSCMQAVTAQMCSRGVLSIAAGCALFATPAHASGQLELYPDPTTLVILIVGFVILIAPLNAMIFRPLFRVIDARAEKIEGATRQAEQLVSQATELTERYRGSIREAREAADVERKEQLEAARSEHGAITGDAKAESDHEIGRARQEIEISLVEARNTLASASGDLAKAAAERILGRALQS